MDYNVWFVPGDSSVSFIITIIIIINIILIHTLNEMWAGGSKISSDHILC